MLEFISKWRTKKKRLDHDIQNLKIRHDKKLMKIGEMLISNNAGTDELLIDLENFIQAGLEEIPLLVMKNEIDQARIRVGEINATERVKILLGSSIKKVNKKK